MAKHTEKPKPRDESLRRLFQHGRALEAGDPAAGKTVVTGHKVVVKDQTATEVTKNGKTEKFK